MSQAIPEPPPKVGDVVKIHSLVSNTGSGYNGRTGRITKDKGADIYVVSLDGQPGGKVKVHKNNLCVGVEEEMTPERIKEANDMMRTLMENMSNGSWGMSQNPDGSLDMKPTTQ
mgnify:FL=1|jgi:hypothetical protein